MTARPGLVTDSQIERMLHGRSATPDASLLAAVLAQVEEAPQDRPWLRGVSAPLSRRTLVLVGFVLLLAAMAAAIAIGFHPPSPLPAVVPHANGEIVIQGDGCSLVALDASTGATSPFFAGVPACIPVVSNYETAWDPIGSRLAFVYSFFCGGCGSEQAKAAIAGQVAGLWVLDRATSKAKQLVRCPIDCSAGEPTWSPDGSRIAFILDGQVWVIPPTGGRPQRLSDGLSSYSHPAWSPDSAEVAYVDANVGRAGPILAKADRTGQSVVSAPPGEVVREIAWSPIARSTLVAAAISDGGTLRIIPSDGSASRAILSLHDGTSPGSPRWSPDGSHIAYERTLETTDPQTPVVLTRAEIWVMAADGSSPHLLFRAPPPLSALSEVLWSPDGRYLTFSLVSADGSRSTIYLAAADGSGVRTLDSAVWNRLQWPRIAWQPLPVRPASSP